MAQRKYSVAEIDHMRQLVRDLLGIMTDDKVVEDRLRTYMINGTEPLELAIATFDKRINHWRNKLIQHGTEFDSGYKKYFPLIELRKSVIRLEIFKTKQGM